MLYYGRHKSDTTRHLLTPVPTLILYGLCKDVKNRASDDLCQSGMQGTAVVTESYN
jgi:hypothetical protein